MIWSSCHLKINFSILSIETNWNQLVSSPLKLSLGLSCLWVYENHSHWLKFFVGLCLRLWKDVLRKSHLFSSYKINLLAFWFFKFISRGIFDSTMNQLLLNWLVYLKTLKYMKSLLFWCNLGPATLKNNILQFKFYCCIWSNQHQKTDLLTTLVR